MLKHSQFTLDVSFFVCHENFLHPKLGNLQEVSRESVHIYTADRRSKKRENEPFTATRDGKMNASASRYFFPGTDVRRMIHVLPSVSTLKGSPQSSAYPRAWANSFIIDLKAMPFNLSDLCRSACASCSSKRPNLFASRTKSGFSGVPTR